MGENINIKTVKDLKTYLDDKIHQLASSESISDIKALVQEQSSLILKITKQSSHRKKKKISWRSLSLNAKICWKSPKQCLLV